MKRSVQEVDEDNEKQTTESGWKELMDWIHASADILCVPNTLRSLLDIGCGKGYILRYAVTATDNNAFTQVNGIENNEALCFLTKLPKNATPIYGDATDKEIMEPLLTHATVIFWNGFKFNSTSQSQVVNLICKYSSVGTMILCNFTISRGEQLMLLKKSVSFHALTTLVEWSHTCEWYLYLVLPWKIKSSYTTNIAALSWLLEAFRIHDSLISSNEMCHH